MSLILVELVQSALWRRDRDRRFIKTGYNFLRKKKSNQVRGGEQTFVLYLNNIHGINLC
jgi:hypothetical protein